jgi:putative ABC transport system permease protein
MFNRNERAHLQLLRSFLSSGAGTGPWLLFAAVGLVLLLVCANVANLALARATARQREIAIRTAIGAHRGRIVRQLLTESVTLALAGGALGVLLCYISFGFIRTLVPEGLMHVGLYRIDGTVLIFSLFLTLCAGIVFGFAPALVSMRVDLSAAFNKGSPEAGTAGPRRLQSALAASEVAVSLVVLIGALLSLQSLARLMGVRLGFDPRHVPTFTVSLPQEKYNTPAKEVELYQQAVDRLQNIPGVQRSAVINSLPFENGGDILFGILGSAKAQPPGTPLGADYRVVSPGFFHTLRIPLLGGRRLARTDDSTNAPVVVINRSMAKMYWGSQDPIGQDILVGKGMGPQFTEPRPREIVGIVGDIRDDSLAEPPSPTMYIPNAQAVLGGSGADGERSFVVRTRQTPEAVIPEVRAAIGSLDASLPVAQLEPMTSIVGSSLVGWRFRSLLLGAFGAMALIIAAIGIYGVISYSVVQRTHEIGIRMALGAQNVDVLRMVVGKGLLLALAGVAAGIGAALALTRFMTSLLFGVSATDLPTFAAVSVVLIAVAVAASAVPARRATKVDPMVALRHE